MRAPPPDDPQTTAEAVVPSPADAYWVLVSCAAGVTSVPLPLRGSVTLGRALECNITIEDDSVSRRHARIGAGDPPLLEAFETRNGTKVAGAALAPGEACAIPAGTTIELGSAMVIVQRGAGLMRAREHPLTRPSVRPAPGLVLEDPTMKRLYGLIATVAPTTISVLVLGETGVGKESIAEAIHARSTRAAKPLLRLNCAALPESILEGELFGYERGAFTGALQAKAGLFEAADGGTVFLDEVGDMPLVTQAKLLRVLEVGEVLRLGSVKPKQIDVRVVAATNRDLQAMIAEGAFRADLFFRLNGLSFTVPPLRSRSADVGPLARVFLARFCEKNLRPAIAITEEAVHALEARPWPGNVRELKAFVERAALLTGGEAFDAAAIEALDDPLFAVSRDAATGGVAITQRAGPRSAPPTNEVPSASLSDSRAREHGAGLRGELGEVEKQRIKAALEACAGNQTRAAKMLKMPRRSLLRRIEEYGLARPRK